MTLTHRTSFGSLIPLVTPSNYTHLIKRNQIPQVIVHLEGIILLYQKTKDTPKQTIKYLTV